MVELTKEEKKFLMELLEEVVNEAKEIERRDSEITQNLTRFVYDENKVRFLEGLKNKVEKIPIKK